MKTDELINALAANVEPVKGGELRRTLVVALTVGAVVAACLMLGLFGVPAGAFRGEYLALKGAALAFTLGLVGAGATFLVECARPGEPGRKPLLAISLLFFAALSATVVAFAVTHPTTWGGMVFGPQWAACLICVPLFALAPFASLIWALRKGAPTNLVLTGAIAGLVAGALGAAVFAIHHPAGSIPFILIWYGGPIVLCALVGAILGPRLLRW